jgi:hypothetical protein
MHSDSRPLRRNPERSLRISASPGLARPILVAALPHFSVDDSSSPFQDLLEPSPMHRSILACGLFVLAGLFSAGCGGEENTPIADPNAPTGQTAPDQMNKMIGVPQPGGELKKE